MRHQNSVFHDLLKHVPWGDFERLVDEHKSDHRVRRLSTKSQFIALLYAQLAGASTLRETVTGLESHSSRLYHLGAKPACRSTLADANAARPAEVFCELFKLMLKRTRRGLRRKITEATYLIDATALPLCGLSGGWAHFSTIATGAKLHVIYDPDADQPIYAALTPAKVNDITAAHDMPVEPGATYVFDLGYYDYAWWAKLDAAGCRVVTRFKANTPLTLIKEQAVAESGNVISDRIGLLPARQAKSRKNPMADPVRELCVRIETGKVLRILSNDLDAPAQDIADLYKRRWAIELFFRWIKQSLKIAHFLGISENAVRIQITVALIAFLLLRMAQATQTIVQSPLAFLRLVRANLMHKKRIDRLLEPEPSPATNANQMSLQWT
jgi:hypothetical protein